MCELCSKVYKSKYNLENHLKEHAEPEKPLECLVRLLIIAQFEFIFNHSTDLRTLSEEQATSRDSHVETQAS